MSVTEQQYELIIKFIDQNLNEKEQVLFDTYLQSNEAFRIEVEQTEVLTAGLKAVEKANEIDRIKGLFDEFDAETNNQSVKQLNLRRLVLPGIAASIVLLAAVIIFFNKKQPVNDTLAIYQSFYQVFPATTEKRSGKEGEAAMRYYEAGEYSKAIPLLIKPDRDTDDLLTPIYLANCYLQVDKPDSAVSVLENASKKLDADTSFTGQFHRWYLGLAYLKSGKKKEAEDIFLSIAQTKGIYQEKSIEILELLN
ncbi:MAG: hypothetical protein AAFQ94_05040 [Bacteroidota bacterium]